MPQLSGAAAGTEHHPDAPAFARVLGALGHRPEQPLVLFPHRPTVGPAFQRWLVELATVTGRAVHLLMPGPVQSFRSGLPEGLLQVFARTGSRLLQLDGANVPAGDMLLLRTLPWTGAPAAGEPRLFGPEWQPYRLPPAPGGEVVRRDAAADSAASDVSSASEVSGSQVSNTSGVPGGKAPESEGAKDSGNGSEVYEDASAEPVGGPVPTAADATVSTGGADAAVPDGAVTSGDGGALPGAGGTVRVGGVDAAAAGSAAASGDGAVPSGVRVPPPRLGIEPAVQGPALPLRLEVDPAVAVPVERQASASASGAAGPAARLPYRAAPAPEAPASPLAGLNLDAVPRGAGSGEGAAGPGEEPGASTRAPGGRRRTGAPAAARRHHDSPPNERS
jgi:hypothetical protein